ncbi:aspartate aminotransferase family protein [Caldovatus sediminis]|jgi:4-aminobutyrate--pyruvate transaminase|uniref:Aspartate aminotransferase family protein n=1 Tax=Caldovatus sediminis TaxID=2041189 RepID=A0A8J3EA41_9PROT|nr:aspartate aminotransferase family protein [Caldovatus sediminis]GGG21996.1 aspartate aminotransferase family protein [Caldovatus sediminis]
MTPPRNSSAARDIAHVLHPYTDHKVHQQAGPVVISRGKGIRVWDDQGKEYIEAVAGLWCAALGFDNERLVKAAEAQMRKLPFYHAFTAKSHEPMIDLAEMLIERAPVPMSKVFFGNSGSEANDSAIKMIWYYNNALGRPRKKKIISRLKAYHGITVASGSLTGLPANHKLFDLPLPGFLHVSTPHHYHGAQPGETEEQFATRLAEELDAVIQREGPETVAAFWAEPVMGAGGVIVPPATYFEKIQAVLRKHDVLLVADEVICGFGRTGSYWGCQTMGIEPDILTCAKALSASFLPISAVMINDKVFQGIAEGSHTIGTWGHGFTYSGHPVPAAVAVETLRIYDEIGLLDHVRRVGPYMQKALRARFADHPLVGEVRGVGLIAAIELVEDKAARRNFDPARKVGLRLAKLGEEHGVILRALINDTIAFSPPLIITEAEIDAMLDRTAAALEALAVQLRRESLAVV